MRRTAYYLKTCIFTASVGVLALGVMTQAQAGFEWVPKTPQAQPQNNQVAQEIINVEQAPVEPVTNEALPRVAPQPTLAPIPTTAQQILSAPVDDAPPSAVMTPSPFDAPVQPAAPQPVRPAMRQLPPPITEQPAAQPAALIPHIPPAPQPVIPQQAANPAPVQVPALVQIPAPPPVPHHVSPEAMTAETDVVAPPPAPVEKEIIFIEPAHQDIAVTAPAPAPIAPTPTAATIIPAVTENTAPEAAPLQNEALVTAPQPLMPAETIIAAPDEQPQPVIQNAHNAGEVIPVLDTGPQPAPAAKSGEERAAQSIQISAYPEQLSAPALPEAAAIEGTYDIAQGFGKDMPLALAVQQIIPADYAYSFAKGINAGQRVSWTGGEAWNVVLDKALEPLALDFRVHDKTVVVTGVAEKFSANVAPAAAGLAPIAAITDNAADAQAAPDSADVLAIEPAAGAEDPSLQPVVTGGMVPSAAPLSLMPEGTAPEAPDAATKRAIIRDPGEAEAEQPNSSKSALLKPASEVAPEIVVSEQSGTEEAEAPAAKAGETNGKWVASNGDSLKKVLYNWGKTADVQIVWEASHDYTLNNAFSSTGSVHEAIEALVVRSVQHENMPAIRFINKEDNADKMALVIIQDSEPEATVTADISDSVH